MSTYMYWWVQVWTKHYPYGNPRMCIYHPLALYHFINRKETLSWKDESLSNLLKIHKNTADSWKKTHKFWAIDMIVKHSLVQKVMILVLVD